MLKKDLAFDDKQEVTHSHECWWQVWSHLYFSFVYFSVVDSYFDVVNRKILLFG